MERNKQNLRNIELRKSHIVEFRRCPYRLKLWLDGHEKYKSAAMIQGTRFHDLAERFFDEVDVKEVEKCKDYRELREYFTSLIPLFPQFADFEARRWFTYKKLGNTEEWKPKLREFELKTHTVHQQFILVGHIDRFDTFLGKGIIYEYKPTVSSYVKFELGYYYLLFNAIRPYGYQATHVAVFGYKTGDFKIWRPSPHTLSAVHRTLDKIWYAIETGEWEKKEYACTFCDFLDICKGGDMDV